MVEGLKGWRNLSVMGTKLCGPAAVEVLDSSGEILSIKGCDISSMTYDGVANYEHKNDLTAQVVGKVIQAKKIFSDTDCSTEQELKYWNKLKKPMIWVVIELLDAEGHSGANDLVSWLRYDQRKLQEGQAPMMNFSIEGAKLHKDGMVITHSIGRKVAISVTPCNKVCTAEEYQQDQPKKTPLASILGKSEFPCELYEPLNKAITASSSLSSPSNLTGGSALAPEFIEKRLNSFLRKRAPSLSEDELKQFSNVCKRFFKVFRGSGVN